MACKPVFISELDSYNVDQTKHKNSIDSDLIHVHHDEHWKTLKNDVAVDIEAFRVNRTDNEDENGPHRRRM